MCAGQELNLHALRRSHLKAVRLPFRHPRMVDNVKLKYQNVKLGEIRESNMLSCYFELNKIPAIAGILLDFHLSPDIPG